MSTTNARTTIVDFTSDEISVGETAHDTTFLAVTSRCDIMVGHPDSTAEEIAGEILALRKLADVAEDVACQLETRQIRRDGKALGRRVAADEGLGEPKVCGHRHSAFTCTLTPGHEDQHEAWGEDGSEPTATWPQITSAADVDRAIAADLDEQTGGKQS